MAAPLLTTKLYVPSPRSELVPRPHLIERLTNVFRLGRKLILISAPAGFGKTTLVSEWVQATTARQAQCAARYGFGQRVRRYG